MFLTNQAVGLVLRDSQEDGDREERRDREFVTLLPLEFLFSW